MKVAVVSANFGKFDRIQDDRITVTEKDFPLRDKSMTPRLQARIVKTHMWQFVPGYDRYLWVDSSCKLKDKQWFLDKLGDKDIVVFKHPHRNTVQQEADYVRHRLAIGCPYITSRYENELIDDQLAEIDPGDELFASTAFIYKDSPKVRQAMKDWWYHISRFHSIDQLSFPWCIKDLDMEVLLDNYENCQGIEFVRNKP